MPDVLISVIMPAYNAENFIAESIESVIKQTYLNWELLIVDDGSTDATAKIIQGFCSKDSRVKYFFQENGKQGKARNLALSFAKGDYIALLDADDVWLPEKLSVQIDEIKETRADLVFSDGFVFINEVSNRTLYRNSGKGYFQGVEGLRSFMERNRIPTHTVLVKSEKLKKVSGFSENPSIQNAEDYHLWLKLLMEGNIFYGSDLVLGGYRIHPKSVSYNDKLSVIQTLEVLQDLKLNYKSHRKLINAFHKVWFNRYHYSMNKWDKENYSELIRKNCSYVVTPLITPFFQGIYSLFGFYTTRTLITKFINDNKF